jgi:hypothetical protein
MSFLNLRDEAVAHDFVFRPENVSCLNAEISSRGRPFASHAIIQECPPHMAAIRFSKVSVFPEQPSRSIFPICLEGFVIHSLTPMR